MSNDGVLGGSLLSKFEGALVINRVAAYLLSKDEHCCLGWLSNSDEVAILEVNSCIVVESASEANGLEQFFVVVEIGQEAGVAELAVEW